MRRPVIAVAGTGRVGPDDPLYVLAHELGRTLVDHRYRVLCGGLGGVMEAVAAGGRSSSAHVDGDVIGILPGTADLANPYVDVAIPTGLGHLRNQLVALADAVIAIGGGAGTLSEMALAWIHGRPVLAFRVDGWSGRLADTALDDRRDDVIYGVDSPADAVEMLGRLLPSSSSR